MRPTLSIKRDQDGHISTNVTAEWMWELVEFLSYQRVHVIYHFGTTHFVVSFPGQEPAAVKQFLTDWTNSDQPADAECHTGVHSACAAV